VIRKRRLAIGALSIVVGVLAIRSDRTGRLSTVGVGLAVLGVVLLAVEVMPGPAGSTPASDDDGTADPPAQDRSRRDRERERRRKPPSSQTGTSGRFWPDSLPSIGRVRRGAFALLVIGVVGVGVAVLASPEVLARTSVARRVQTLVAASPVSVELLGRGVGAAAFLFVLVALLGAGRSRSRSGSDPGTTAGFRTAIEERITGVSTAKAGSDVDDAVAHLRDVAGTGEADAESNRRQYSLRQQLGRTAVTILVRVESCSSTRANRLLDTGRWTDDPRAAAFFSTADPPWPIRIRDLLSFTPTTVRRAEHVIDELDRRLEETGPGGADGTPDDEIPDGETTSREAVAGSESSSVLHSLDGSGRDDESRNRGGAETGSGHGTATRETVVSAIGRFDPRRETADRAATDGDGSAESLTTGGSEESVAHGADRDPVVSEARRSTAVRQRNAGNAAGLLAVAVGIATATPIAVLLGIVVVLYGLVDFVTTEPGSPVEIERVVASGQPMPRDRVEVRTTITNVGESVLPDVRVVDGVPDPLPLVEGSPAIHTALRPGESDEIRYTLRAKRGTFTFDETEISLRNIGGTNVVEGLVPIETPVRCSTLLDDFPLHNQTDDRVGEVRTDSGGTGIEFFATREYREGDPMNRIDWNHLAKTSELTTVQYREHRTATVVLLVDAREETKVARDSTELDAVDLSAYAAERTFLTLLDRHVDVGVLTYNGSALQHVPPEAGETQRARLTTTVREVSDRYDTLRPPGTEAGRWTSMDRDAIRDVRRRLPATAQVVLFSPVVDDFPVEASRTLQASGHAVTVFSPAAVGEDSLGQRASKLERSARLRAIRDVGATVIDWDTSEGVETAVTRVVRRYRS
jgi:uncharacterized protein (DUF58 family)